MHVPLIYNKIYIRVQYIVHVKSANILNELQSLQYSTHI